MALTADIVRPSDLTARDREAWAALRSTHPDFANPLLSPEFAVAVGTVRPDAVVAVLRRGGKAVGVLAHHRRPGGFARPIGAPFSDYHAVISGPEPGFTGAEALAAARIETYAYSSLLDPHGLFGPQAEMTATHLVAVEDTPEAYLEGRRALSAKHFKNWRRLESKAQREIGPFRLGYDHDEAAFQLLLDWKRRQLDETGRHDFLKVGLWTERLMRDLFARRDGAVPSLMLTLWAGDRLMAGHFGLREGPVFHPWLASMNPEMRPYSPGQAFLSQAVRAMPQLGLKVLDLGGGHDHYKAPFASRQGSAAVGVARASARSGAAAELMSAAAIRLAGPAKAASIRRRLDHIAQVELSLGGRMRGVARAFGAKAMGARELGADA